MADLGDVDAATLIVETQRLQLRKLALSDAQFLVTLLNDPSWQRNIGDRGVRNDADAEGYIRNSVWSQYQAHGFGMYVVQLRATALPIGLCGLVKREFLGAPDVGFALLPAYVGQGYAFEAAHALMGYATSELGIERLYAIVKPGNDRSVRLLERLGFRHEGLRQVLQGAEVDLYTTDSKPHP